jgi:peptidoglycan/LPS O-acetylase OafA/YrhL
VIGLLWSDLEHSTDEAEPIKKILLKFFQSKRTPLILLAISFAVSLYSDIFHHIPGHLYTFFNLLVRAIGFTLLVHNFEFIRKIFTMKPFAFLGEISFSLYLIHIPVLFSVGASIYLYACIPAPYKLIVTFLSVIAVTVIASYLFTIYIDRKAVALSNKIGKYFVKEVG